MSRRLIALALLALLAPPVAAQEPAPASWLDRAVSAPASVSYRGTKVVILWSSGGAEASTVQVDHQAPNLYRLEYVPTPGRQRRLVIDDGKTRWQYEASVRLALRSPSSVPGDDGLPVDRLSLLRANYAAAVIGDDRVAGRNVVVVALRPRSGPRPTLLLWLDADTGLVLRSERRHADGSLAQAAAFTEIRLEAPPRARFTFIPPGGVEVRRLSSSQPLRVEDIASRMGFRPIAPKELPEGFVLDRVLASGSHATPVAVLQFTDGLATLSLFERRAIEGARRTLETGHSVSVASGTGSAQQVGDVAILHWQTRGVDMTLTGELSPDHLTRIAAMLGVEGSPGRVARLKFWLASLWKHLASVM